MNYLDHAKNNLKETAFYGICLCLGLKIIWKSFKIIKNKVAYNRLKNEVKIMIEERDKKLASFYEKYKNEVSKELQQKILDLDSTKLLDEIKNKRITSRSVFITFALRICTVGKDLCSLTDCNLDEGLLLADNADKIISDSKSPDELPDLIGLPVSIKDHIRVKGLRNSYGMMNSYNEIDNEDSYIVEILKNKGGIPICKSNVPLGLLSFESGNDVWGNSQNPWNREKTTGGSSGGEAGLVSTKCAPLGIGSDIGGSIRIPANFCGIYGFKPSINRLSQMGVKTLSKTNHSGFNIIRSSLGPLGNTMDDLVLFCKAFFGEFKNDYNFNQAKFNENEFKLESIKSKDKSKLKIGYSYINDYAEIAPGIVSEMNILLEKLKLEGHEVIEFDYSPAFKVLDIGLEIIFNSQKFQTFFKNQYPEPIHKYYKSINMVLSMPNYMFPLLKLIYNMTGNKRMAKIIGNKRNINSLPEYFNLVEEFFRRADDFYDHYRKFELDCLVLPILPTTALGIGMGDLTVNMIFYSMTLNMLNFPAGSIPLGLLKDTNYKSKYNDKMTKTITENISSSLNIPVGIQVATIPGEDEKCLGIMKMIDNLVKERKENEYREYFKTKENSDSIYPLKNYTKKSN